MKVRREGTHKIACGWCLLAVADVVANANLQILVLNWSHSAISAAAWAFHNNNIITLIILILINIHNNSAHLTLRHSWPHTCILFRWEIISIEFRCQQIIIAKVPKVR